jgi:hypothetical protein
MAVRRAMPAAPSSAAAADSSDASGFPD